MRACCSKGRPTAFGAAGQTRPARRIRRSSASTWRSRAGSSPERSETEAYLRIVPQANSTFHGEFTRDFSGEKPLTNLLAVDRRLPERGHRPAGL